MRKETGIIFDIKHFAVHDGPGIRTTVFFKGCPLNCWWCHNPESQSTSIEKINANTPRFEGDKHCKEIIGKEVSVSEVVNELVKDIIFYNESNGGITFSGGEALMQPDFLYALLKKCKEQEIHTCLDTSGYADKVVLEQIIDLVDLFLYDLKILNEAEHLKYTGVSLKPIISNLEYLCEKNKEVIVRIPIIPTITDTDENIELLGAYISSLQCIKRVDLLPYNKMGEDKYRRLSKPYLLNNIETQSQARMDLIKEKFESFNLNVKIGG